MVQTNSREKSICNLVVTSQNSFCYCGVPLSTAQHPLPDFVFLAVFKWFYQTRQTSATEFATSGRSSALVISALASVLYLQRHLNEHQEFLDADPDSLSLELLRDAGTLFVCEAPQQLQTQQGHLKG